MTTNLFTLLSASAALAGTLLVGCAPTAAPTEGATGEATTGGGARATGSMNAVGSTFVQPFLTKAFSQFQEKSGFEINYGGGGSGKGISSVIDGADFAASDAPMSEKEIADAKREILNLPFILGAVTVIYNIPGVESGLKLEGPLVADIFMGKVTKWNDPRIVALNPDITLPDLKIAVQVRSDSSGTSYVLTDYLAAVSTEFNTKIGKTKKPAFGDHVGAWQGNEGVSSNVRTTEGSIGYTELTWAVENKLATAAIKNQAGQWISPNVDSVTAAAEAALPNLPADFRMSLVNQPGEQSYPLASFVYALVPSDLTASNYGPQVVSALKYLLTDAQSIGKELNYAPLPDSLVAKVQEAVNRIKVK